MYLRRHSRYFSAIIAFSLVTMSPEFGLEYFKSGRSAAALLRDDFHLVKLCVMWLKLDSL